MIPTRRRRRRPASPRWTSTSRPRRPMPTTTSSPTAGTSRRRHGGLDRAEPVAHLHHGRRVHRQGDGVRRRGDAATRTVTVTVLGADDPDGAVPRARVLQDDRVPARLDPGRHRGGPLARRGATTSRSTPPRTRRVFTRRDPVALRRGRVHLDDGRPAQRRAAGGVRALHPRGRRLRRRPRGGRHRVRLAWYGGLVGAYFRNHPAGTPTATVRIDDPDHHSTEGLPNPWSAWTSGTTTAPRTGSAGRTTTARARRRPRAADGRRVDLRRGRRQHDGRRPSDLVVPALRGRPLVVHGHGPHPGDVHRGGVPAHLLGGLEIAAGVVKDADCGKEAAATARRR